MGDAIFLILRRMRAPLITLISVYAISVAGFAMIPALDPQGQPWTMNIFHAFYVISYTATTIGFGEIPHPFNDLQRLWVTGTIYLSVVAWAYTIGSVFALTQDATVRETFYRAWISLRVRGLAEPFYIVCGYGQSGRAMCRALDTMGIRVVVIETRPERAAGIAAIDYQLPPVVIRGDARVPEVLVEAGVESPYCRGVLALAGGDGPNQSIAISAAMLRPGLQVVARAVSQVARDNLESFPHVEVVNPFETFASNVGLALTEPAVLQLEEWLTGAPGTERPEFVRLPKGHWIVCGYGRFGHALGRTLDAARISWHAIDPGVAQESLTDHSVVKPGAAMPRDAKKGIGKAGVSTPAVPEADDARVVTVDDADFALDEAGIEQAVGFVAGTDNDAVNLALANRARKRKPELFVIIRQNQVANRLLIEAAGAQMKFVQAALMVHECLQILTSPLTNRFLTRMRRKGAEAASQTMAALQAVVGERVPELWGFSCDTSRPGLRRAFSARIDPPFALHDLLTDPADRTRQLGLMALLLVREGKTELLPAPDTLLEKGDEVLFAGRPGIRRIQLRYAYDPVAIEYVRTGHGPPRGTVFRWFALRSILRARERAEQEHKG